MRSVALLCFALLGCGRIAFDPRADGRGAVGPADARVIAGLQPLAWWKLDDASGTTVRDSVGTLDGTLYPGTNTTLPMWAPVGGNDPNDYAVLFEGDGEQALVTTGPSILDNLPAVTVAGWIFPLNVTDDSLPHCVFDKANIDTGWVFHIADSANGTLAFWVLGPGWHMSARTGADAIATGRWIHVAATWDGGMSLTGIHLYIDGAEVTPAATTPAGGPRPGDDSSADGAINCNAMTSLAGMLDDIILFDRVLTPAEVAILYGS